MEIIHKSENSSITYELKYIVKPVLRNYGGIGRSYPKCTQCLIFANGLLKSSGEVTKHARDEDNQQYAYREATKKALENIGYKSLRKELWKKVFSEIDKLEDV
jgi:hypothetical protein